MSKLSDRMKSEYVAGNGISLMDARLLIDEYERLEMISREKDSELEAADAKIAALTAEAEAIKTADTLPAQIQAKVNKMGITVLDALAELERYRKAEVDGLMVRLPRKAGTAEGGTGMIANRYFDFPDAKVTLCVGVKPGSAAALATPEKIKEHFKQKGRIREIDSREYTYLTDIYSWNGAKHSAADS